MIKMMVFNFNLLLMNLVLCSHFELYLQYFALVQDRLYWDPNKYWFIAEQFELVQAWLINIWIKESYKQVLFNIRWK